MDYKNIFEKIKEFYGISSKEEIESNIQKILNDLNYFRDLLKNKCFVGKENGKIIYLIKILNILPTISNPCVLWEEDGISINMLIIADEISFHHERSKRDYISLNSQSSITIEYNFKEDTNKIFLKEYFSYNNLLEEISEEEFNNIMRENIDKLEKSIK